MLLLYAAMSLRDFIRAKAKDIQDANAKKVASIEQTPPNQTDPEAIAEASLTKEKDETEKEE